MNDSRCRPDIEAVARRSSINENNEETRDAEAAGRENNSRFPPVSSRTFKIPQFLSAFRANGRFKCLRGTYIPSHPVQTAR